MPSELRRPPIPDLSDWTGQIERELVASVRPTKRARTRPQLMERVLRITRSFARPAGHGIAAMAASLVVVTSLSVPAPVDPSAVTTPRPLPALDQSLAVTPAESAGFIALLPPEDAEAVRTSDIQLTRSALTEAPQSDAPAVPTPDGGGWTEATLRPTVR